MSQIDDSAMDLLGELAGLGMVVVRQLSQAIEATQDTQALIGLAGAFHQVGRGVRQSIALRLRIAAGTFPGQPSAARTDAAPAERPAPPDAEGAPRVGWNEYERADYEAPDYETPDGASVEAGAGDEPVAVDLETAVLRIRRDYARGHAALQSPPRRAGRGALLAGSAALRLADTS